MFKYLTVRAEEFLATVYLRKCRSKSSNRTSDEEPVVLDAVIPLDNFQS